DLDPWTFTANAKERILLRLATTNFNGKIQLYGPDGAFLQLDQNDTDVLIDYQTTNSGTFTVVVSSYFANGTGTYRLHYLKIPGGFVVPAGDDGGSVQSGSQNGTILRGDLDPWKFTACKGDFFSLRLNTTNFNGKIQLYGPDGA